MLLWLIGVACSGDVPAATPSVAASGPVTPPIDAPVPAKAPSSCDGGDVLFQCAVNGGKELLVCGKDGPSPWLSYRFGKPDAPDLVFPVAREGSASAFAWAEVTTVQAMGNLLRFQNADVTYEIVEMIGAGGPNGEANNFAGVYVKKGEELLATVTCASPAVSRWDVIRAAASH